MNSIRIHLATMLIAAFSLVSFLAALNGYLSSMTAAEKLLDSQLHHASEIFLLADHDADSAVIATQYGNEFVFQVWINNHLAVRSSYAPETPINTLQDGFRYSNFSGYRWRTLTKQQGDKWVIVAERADLRHLIAEKVVLESVLPMLLWLPISAILIWILIGLGLKPLRQVSGEINARRSDNLTPIDYEKPPAELVQLIESTNALLLRLQASFDREKHFAAHAAHELRTPLSALKVHLHNLAKDLPANHPGLALANSGVEQMHHLVEQILDLNRTHPEIIEARFQACDLHKLAQQVTAAAWPSFEQKQQSIALNGNSVMMTGDPQLLDIMLQNLLTNANKYTPAGGTIEVTVDQHDGCVRLQVADSGCGIAPIEYQRVFERFARVDSPANRDIQGSGLGLTIVQHIIQLHGGNIQLNQCPTLGGLQVTITFPLLKETA